MKLLAIRDFNQQDPIGGLGPKIEPTPAPTPEPKPQDGPILVGPDGKMSTNIPPPAVWPFSAEGARPGAKPEPSPLAKTIAYLESRPPIKVGDRVRVKRKALEYRAGDVLEVSRISADGAFWTADDDTAISMPFSNIAHDGVWLWERA